MISFDPTTTSIAIGSVIATGLITYLIGRRDSRSRDKREILSFHSLLENEKSTTRRLGTSLENLTKELADKKERLAVLEQIAQRYQNAKSELSRSKIVWDYDLPVMLIGPRNVGKTSLLMQLHSPWVTTDTSPTSSAYDERYSLLPIYDFTKENKEPHFAVPEVQVTVDVHLGLKIFDFPGDLAVQEKIKQIIVNESSSLQENTGKNLGVVLIFMFDAEEVTKQIDPSTKAYYNGDLFRELHSLVSFNKISIDRIIITFNKFDRLKIMKPNLSDQKLLELCETTFADIIGNIDRICNPQKVCKIPTIFDRENMQTNNKGASIVIGVAAHTFVGAFIGLGKASEIFPDYHTVKFSSKPDGL